LISKIPLNSVPLIRRYFCPCDIECAKLAIAADLAVRTVNTETGFDIALAYVHDAGRISRVPDHINA